MLGFDELECCMQFSLTIDHQHSEDTCVVQGATDSTTS